MNILAARSLKVFAFSALLAAGEVGATTVSYDFTTGGVNSAPGVSGNTVTFTGSTPGYTVSLTSWTDGGVGTLSAATGHVISATNVSGFGVCDSTEGTFAACIGDGGNAPMRGIDNLGGQNWVLLVFSQAVDLRTFTMFPDVGNGNKDQDRDVTYFTGFVSGASAIAGRDYSYLTGTLGLTQFNVGFGKGKTAVTVDVMAQNGGTPIMANAILIGGSLTGGADRAFLTGITTVVPVPAAVWLFVSAFGVLFGYRRVS
jgi:hypothetical protein